MRAYRSRLRQAIAARGIGADASSLLPTPTTANNLLAPYMQRWPAHRRLLPTLTAQSYGSTNNGTRDGKKSYKTKGTLSLEAMAKKGTLLPTLTASSATRGKAMRGKNAQGGPSLQEALSPILMPTLCARDEKGPGPRHTKGGDDLPRRAGGHLSPTFCEWYMGYPRDWSALSDAGPSPRRPGKGSPGSETP